MARKNSVWIRACMSAMICALLVGMAGSALANYDLSWFTIDNGGGVSSGGSFTLTGSIGQPDADVTMTGGSYTLTGGFLSDPEQDQNAARNWLLYD